MAWQRILEFAESDARALEAACREPGRHQRELLRSLVAANRSTSFGREHRFDALETFEDYQNAVPTRTYREIEPWIQRCANGERNVLTRDDVIAFEETSGTSSGRKLIPYTAESLNAFRSAVLPWLTTLLRRRPAIANGRAYVATSPVNRVSRALPCGLSVGLPSEVAYLGRELEPPLGSLMAVLPTGTSDIDEWRRQTVSELAKCRDLTLISIWSPTFLLELLDGIPHGAWPNLDTISMWTDAASAPYAKRVAEIFPGVHIDSKGILSTESAVTVRIDDDPGCVPALTSAVIEFMDASGSCKLSDDLDEGATYRVVITTPGGLYRYDTGDEVRCLSIHRGLPRLQFVGRAGLVSDLVGEKLTEGFVSASISDLSHPASLVPQGTPNPHYEVWVDAANDGNADTIARRVDGALRRNVQYAYARDLGQLRAPVTIFRPGFVQYRRHALVARGHRLGDVKLSALILDRTTLP